MPRSSLGTRTVTTAFGAKVSITNRLAYRFAIPSRAFCAAESIDSSASVSKMEGVAAAMGSNITGSIAIEVECGRGEGGSTGAVLPGAGGAALPGAGGVALPGAGGTALPGAGGTELPSNGGAVLPGDGVTALPGNEVTALPGDEGAALPGIGGAALPGDGGAVP